MMVPSVTFDSNMMQGKSLKFKKSSHSYYLISQAIDPHYTFSDNENDDLRTMSFSLLTTSYDISKLHFGFYLYVTPSCL